MMECVDMTRSAKRALTEIVNVIVAASNHYSNLREEPLILPTAKSQCLSYSRGGCNTVLPDLLVGQACLIPMQRRVENDHLLKKGHPSSDGIGEDTSFHS